MKRKQIFLRILTIGTMSVSLVACSSPPGNKAVMSQSSETGPMESKVVTSQAPETGIQYAYCLALDDDDVYEANQNDVNYRLIYYGGYLTVYITNQGTRERIVGGEYRLQRFVGGEYIDIEDNNNLIRGGVHVQDMPLIELYDQADGSEIILANEDDQFTVYPNQTINANFLTMQYPIFDDPSYEGAYRFIYGDVMIEFKLICDIAC